MDNFEAMLTGGHPNSLGRTEEVVDMVISDPPLIRELYDTYQSEDEVVRLRVSSAFKRITKQKPELMTPYIDRFIDEVAKIDQPSAQWSFAQIMLWLDDRLSDLQRKNAIIALQRILGSTNDWIALNMIMETLTYHAHNDAELCSWLIPYLQKYEQDSRKSVANRAKKFLREIN